MHWFTAFAVFAGAWISGFFIVATNAFMQHPVGYELQANGHLHLTSFWSLLLNPWVIWQYTHTMIGATTTGAFVMAAIGLAREIWGKARPEIINETGGGAEATESWSQYLVIGAWGAGFFLAIYLLGFFIAIPLFILSAMKLGGTRWWVAAILAILVTAFIYGLFDGLSDKLRNVYLQMY